MKKIIFVTIFLLLGSVATRAQSPCDPSLWARVYSPQRFEGRPPRHPCVVVTGSIRDVSQIMPDGDLHILFKVDPRFEGLLRPSNHGLLTLEVVCADNTPQTHNAREPCKGYYNPIPLRREHLLSLLYKHVSVTGELVHDMLEGHGGHTELHPVSRVNRIP